MGYIATSERSRQTYTSKLSHREPSNNSASSFLQQKSRSSDVDVCKRRWSDHIRLPLLRSAYFFFFFKFACFFNNNNCYRVILLCATLTLFKYLQNVGYIGYTFRKIYMLGSNSPLEFIVVL